MDTFPQRGRSSATLPRIQDTVAMPAARRRPPLAWRPLAAFALTSLVLHFAIAGRYGWFRDELYYIDAGRHLDWGYVEFPVMVALLANVQRALFGTSLAAIHVLPAIAGALIIVLIGSMAREMGGGRRAQVLAGLSALAAPIFLGSTSLFTMDVFDELWWTLGALILLRLLAAYQYGEQISTSRGSLWLAFGAVCGLGLLTKLTILAFGLAVVMGLLLHSARREFLTPWPYLGGATALLALLPYIFWQTTHDWATLVFWHNYGHGEDTAKFLLEVILLMNPLALPLWIGGLWALLRAPAMAPFRPLGWVFVVLFVLFLSLHSKSYFLLPAMGPLLAAGAVLIEARFRVRAVLGFGAALVLVGGVLAPVVAPILPARTLHAVMPSPIQPVADRFGWPQFVGTVAVVYRRLSPAERSRAVILAGNYGEAGAVDLLGPEYGLPRVISPHNTFYFWGRGVTPSGPVIATDYERWELRQYFTSVQRVATVPAQDGIRNEEVGRAVWLCRDFRMPWAQIWPRLKNFS